MRNIKNLTIDELKEDLRKMGEEPYRARQVFQWIHQKGVTDFDGMRNLSKSLKEKLKTKYSINTPELSKHLKSKDGTEKFLFKLKDGNFIESVLIPAKARSTLCISTQVGCKFACAFCASGFNGFVRNLETSEILDQILFLRHKLKVDLSNYVFMGMGEPLDNIDNLFRAIRIMNDPKALAIAARRITISTCGITPAIKKLIDLKLQVNLSISLHATSDKIRNQLVPINKRYPLEGLIGACEEYLRKTNRLITLEYVLIENKNDSLAAADELSEIAKILKAKVNIIPYSFVEELGLKPTGPRQTEHFLGRLKKQKVNVTLRDSKGKDIKAACGQLAGKHK